MPFYLKDMDVVPEVAKFQSALILLRTPEYEVINTTNFE
jgi:hypothetical protein